MSHRVLAGLLLLVLLAPGALAQSVDGVNGGAPGLFGGEAPRQFEILAVNVEGAGSESVASYVRQTSGLEVGQSVLVPGDPAFSDAIRNIYGPGLFSDVKIVTDSTQAAGVYLTIRVKEEPKLGELKFEGMKKGDRDDLKEQLNLLRGRPVRPADIENAKQVIKDHYRSKGFLLTDVDAVRSVNPQANTVDLTLKVDRGERIGIEDIVVHGNEEVSDGKLISQMKSTRERKWWRFWKRSRFDEKKLDEDLANVLEYYRKRGYYDARIVSDSVYTINEEGDPEVVVEVTVHEGPQYHIRNIEWEGNTVYSDEVLSRALGFEKGDVYDKEQLDQNLYANRQSTDVASLYMNLGYMKFNAQPSVRIAPGDSLDITFDVTEGDVYTFGQVDIAGNTKTKEHVIRRELYTIPGQTFSRESIQESIRRLAQLNYFNQETLQTGPNVQIDEANKEVDLAYRVEEVGSDQLELSGTWSQYGLILMLRFGFNNFSAQRFFDKDAWKPLPSGDGQKLALSVQTNGRYYQAYSLSFTEPWFRGRPTPVGFSLGHRRLGGGLGLSRFGGGFGTDELTGEDRSFINSDARFFVERRLQWPDDYFNSGSSIGYQYYLNNGIYSTLPNGVSQEISVEQRISRNSLDNPVFPTRGSSSVFSVRVAPPVPGFIQYHKWRFTNNWNVPLRGKLSFGLGADFGYVGSLTGEPVTFERFDLGGSPFESQGYYTFGTDIVYMRGYPRSALTPRDRNNDEIGGTILNKFTSELRWLAVQTPQLQAAPYLFLDAANTWAGFRSYNPAELYRAAGVGVRLVLPIVGMVELTYGYNFDTFLPAANTEGKHNGQPRWLFQFSLGQGFGQ